MNSVALTQGIGTMSENTLSAAGRYEPVGETVARSAVTPWVAALVFSLMSAFSGLALGYVLSGQPDLALVRAKLTGSMYHAMHLRIDYELRKASFCDRSPHCRRVSVGYR